MGECSFSNGGYPLSISEPMLCVHYGIVDIEMNSRFRARQFFCVDPISPSCRRGFVSHARFLEHKRTLHDPTRSQTGRNGGKRDHDGSYYTPHPVLNGKCS